jgi:hypothetical protein
LITTHPNPSTTLTEWQSPAGTRNGHQTTGPCSTIFIANLGQGIFLLEKNKNKKFTAATNSPQIVEEELKNLFGMFQGFSRIRMRTKV